MGLKLSQNGIRILKNFEGVRLTAYKCTAGKWTIGVGHTGSVDGVAIHSGMKITEAKCDELLKTDIVRFENTVNNKCKNLNLNQNEFDALVSFTFNLGEGGLATLIKNRNKKQIADALLLYNKSGGKVTQGLVTRRQKERELFLTPCTDNDNVVENTAKTNNDNTLPYKVKTTSDLNIRSGAGTNHGIIRTAKKGEILTVWAIETNGNTKWGKNGKEYFSLAYCERI